MGSPAAAFVRSLTSAARAHAGDAPALFSDAGPITYRELWGRVDGRLAELDLTDRTLAVLYGSNSVEFVVTYLALVHGGHVPVLAASRSHADRLVAAWRPGLVATVDHNSLDVERCSTDAVLHPDLAMLLGTSGSTASPKLVRLSHENLFENASSIAAYLGLDDTDVGITSLPLHYCYGLSVLHSHLLVGAAVVITDASVVDPRFADVIARHGVTNLAGVPHTFEMLERSGPEQVFVPSMRLITQAGGRMRPEHVRRWVDRADDRGAELFVMYGQTEATARIAYLPPELARDHPGAIGIAIPGGHLRLDREPGAAPDAAGELVYSGPNVMMGYARHHSDLGRGRDIDELRTGDLARYDAEAGVFEIVGRRARFVKPFGLRIDLDEVESQLAPAAHPVAVAGDDDGIVVLAPGANPTTLRDAVVAATGLPPASISIAVSGTIPRTGSGKIDYAAVADERLGASVSATRASDDATGAERSGHEPEAAVASVFAAVLGVEAVSPERSFVDLGGDSLSYIECSVRLEQVLGRVPADWHLQPIATLAAAGPAGRRRQRLARIDTTVVLRAVGICLVVSTHMRLRHLPGGAHLMLGVVGYNMARFSNPSHGPFERLRSSSRTLARVAFPTLLWIAVGVLAFGSYSLGTFLLVNNYVGPRSHVDDHWHFWFIEVFVHLVVAMTLLLSVPFVRRLERRFPYAFALGLLAAVYTLQMEWASLGDWYNMRFRTHAVAIFFVLGWLVHRSSTPARRAVTSVLCFVVVSGFFRNETREILIAGGLTLLAWTPTVPWPRVAVRLVGAVAAASMWIYISHFTFWPLLDDTLDLRRDVAYVATLAVGVAIWAAAERAEPVLVDAARRPWRRMRRRGEARSGPRAAIAG